MLALEQVSIIMILREQMNAGIEKRQSNNSSVRVLVTPQRIHIIIYL